MSGALVEPEPEEFPNRHRWAVAVCHRLMEHGFLDGRFEVLDGEVLDEAGQTPLHSASLTPLLYWLGILFGASSVRTTSPTAIPAPDADYNEPEPDDAVPRDPVKAFDSRHPGPDDLLLVVEISDSTLRTDIAVKSRLYARSGIAEYWFVDLFSRVLYQYRNPIDGAYSLTITLAENETASPLANPGGEITVRDLLPSSK